MQLLYLSKSTSDFEISYYFNNFVTSLFHIRSLCLRDMPVSLHMSIKKVHKKSGVKVHSEKLQIKKKKNPFAIIQFYNYK